MADGGVVVFGGYSETDWPPSRTGAVRRLNASGALDPDFFRSTFTYRDGDLPEFVDAAVDSLGRIYVSGIFDTVNDQPRVGLVRFLPDGTVDPTFAPTRVVIPSAVAFTPGEKLVALVFGQDLVWFNDDGSVENSITFPTGHKEYPFAVASDGRIAMVGTDDRVRVYLPDGTADGSFSSDVNLGPVNRIAWDGNKILACASTNGSWGNPIHGVVRLNADGSRDMTWSRSAVCADRTWVGNITRDSDGSWLISGLFTSFAGVPRAGVARLEPAEATELTWFNTSARGRVTAADPLIVGFVVGGNAPQSLLVRGVGQSLDQFGITDTLAQPVLRVHRGETLLLERKGRSDTVDVDAVAQEVGAFALGSTSNGDAADLIVLPPGAYTLVISSGDGTEGTALGEVYSLDAQ